MIRPPVPSQWREISYPEIFEERLSNGLTVLALPDSRLPRVVVKLGLPSGRAHGPDDHLALLPLALELLAEGTETRSAREISDLMDYWAIQYESSLTMENVLLSFGVLESYLEAALDLFSDLTCRPTFPDEELGKLKVRWRSALMAQRSQPDFLARERTYHSIYPRHPYAKVSIPLEHLEKVEREEVRSIYRRHFLPNNGFLIFAGAVVPDRAVQLAQRFFGSWRPAQVPQLQYPPLQAMGSRRVCLIDRPHSAQAQLLVAGRTLAKTHPQALPLKVANQVLGGGASSRLFLNLRETHGFTYGAYSRLKSYRRDGLFLAGASVRTDVTLESLREILRELAGVQEQAPSQQELKRCQSELTGALLRQMETPGSISELELVRRLDGLPADYYKNFIPLIREVDSEKVVALARRFFDPEKVLVTVVADRSRVEKDLAQVGEVQVYDTLGNRL